MLTVCFMICEFMLRELQVKEKWIHMFYANYDMYDMKTIHGILYSCIYVIHKGLAYVFENLFKKPTWGALRRK